MGEGQTTMSRVQKKRFAAEETSMTRSLVNRICVGVMLAGSLGLSAAAQAQGNPAANYPNRFIKLVVPYTAGGGTDIVGRVVGEKLAERLGQPVVIDNRPGGGARVGVEYAATQPADGYTILIAGGNEMAINPLIYKVGYTASQSFMPLTIAIEMPLILLVPVDHPAKTVAELIAWSKANSDKSNYATTAAGFTLPFELFKLKTGTQATRVAYRSVADGSIALLNGTAQMAMFTPPGIVNQVKEGKVRALAVTSPSRSPDLPDVPTLKELGIDMTVTNWNGFFVPAGTPQPIYDKLVAETRRVVLNEGRDKLRSIFTNPVAKTPEESARHIESDLKLWRNVIDTAKLKLGD
jgi:tripartite-type tricarboxylate transporter receptor subunit TctC